MTKEFADTVECLVRGMQQGEVCRKNVDHALPDMQHRHRSGFLRSIGKPVFITTNAVVTALIREGVLTKPVVGKRDMKTIQDTFNAWSAQSGRDLTAVLDGRDDVVIDRCCVRMDEVDPVPSAHAVEQRVRRLAQVQPVPLHLRALDARGQEADPAGEHLMSIP